MTFQLPRILHISFSTFYACQSVLFLYLATSFAKKRAVTKHLTSKFCFVQHFLIKIQLTRFMVKCAKVEEAARSYLECTLTLNAESLPAGAVAAAAAGAYKAQAATCNNQVATFLGTSD